MADPKQQPASPLDGRQSDLATLAIGMMLTQKSDGERRERTREERNAERAAVLAALEAVLDEDEETP
jgi:hypothetical protein